MKFSKFLAMLACTVALTLGASSALAGQSCCVKAKAEGKDCAHKCCVEARKTKKACDKCQPKPSCCDKKIVEGKECDHKCCVEATKAKKICDKCNPVDKKT